MQSVHKALFHIIITSSGQKKFLSRVNQDILYNYISSVLYNKLCTPVIINGHSNHMHLIIKMSADLSIKQLVKEIQQNSIDFLRRERSVFPEFTGWDSNYISISYHPSQQEELIEKIKTQFDYHRNISFEDELNEIFS